MTFEITIKTEKYRHCGFCEVVCRSQETCIGCAACVDACPYEARELEEIAEQREIRTITVNHENYHVPACIRLC
jgi:Fe-S-cluster-containing dehydrogenase component